MPLSIFSVFNLYVHTRRRKKRWISLLSLKCAYYLYKKSHLPYLIFVLILISKKKRRSIEGLQILWAATGLQQQLQHPVSQSEKLRLQRTAWPDLEKESEITSVKWIDLRVTAPDCGGKVTGGNMPRFESYDPWGSSQTTGILLYGCIYLHYGLLSWVITLNDWHNKGRKRLLSPLFLPLRTLWWKKITWGFMEYKRNLKYVPSGMLTFSVLAWKYVL